MSSASHPTVAMVLPTLAGGGAERIASELANHWVDQQRDVALITIDGSDSVHYPLDARVRRSALNLSRESYTLPSAIRQNARRVRRLREAIRETQARQVVSFTDVTNVTTLLACRPLSIDCIVCERTDPRRHALGTIWSWLRHGTYGRASGIVVQTRGVAEWANAQGWNIPVRVISNPAPRIDGTRTFRELPPFRVVSVGRLSAEKGHDLLIEAFAQLAPAYPNWHLHLYGEGRQRAQLESLIRQSRLEERVHLSGWIADVTAALQQADLFVLPSRYEGFPNALLEAMSAGLPCVSFDCDSGPRDIIRHEVDGLLVPPEDVVALVAAMGRIMSDTSLRQQLGERAGEVTHRFSREAFFEQWDEILAGRWS